MKPLPATLLGCALGLALGWSLRSPGTEVRDTSEFAHGRTSRGNPSTKVSIRGEKNGAGGTNASTSTASVTSPTKRDLSLLLRSINLHALEGDPYVVREAERLDTESLRALVFAMTTDSLLRDTQDQFEMSLSLKAIATAQFRREGVRALEWASQLPDPKVRELVMLQTMRAAMAQDPGAALPWFDKLKADSPHYGQQYEWSSAAVMGATSRSVDDLIALHKLYGDRLQSTMWPTGPYAPDFDFAKLMTDGRKAGLPVATDETIKQWALRDRDAVFKALTNANEAGSDRTYIARGLYTALLAAEGYEGAAREALAPYQDTPGMNRDEMIRAMSYTRYDLPGATAKTMPYLAEADQGTLAQAMLRASTDVRETGPVFAAMSSPAMRVETLSNYIRSNPRGYFNSEEKQQKYYEDLMNASGFTEEEKARIRLVKPDPNARGHIDPFAQ